MHIPKGDYPEDNCKENEKRNSTSTPVKTMEVLEVLATSRNGLGVTEISRMVDLNKSTVYRILMALVDKQYVLKDESIKRYRLGFKLLLLSNQALDSLELRKIARPELNELSRLSSETVHLVWLERDEGVYVEKIDTPEGVGLLSRVGNRLPLYSTGVGKAMLAFMDDNRIQSYLQRITLMPKTPYTIISAEQLQIEIMEIRKNGYAVDHQENRLGVVCVAAPIFDSNGNVIAAISVSGPNFRFSEEKANSFGPILKGKALQVSEKLGY